MSEILSLSPQKIWYYFDQITKVPRPSKKEEKILKYLEDFALEHKLQTRRDEIGNIVIVKPATLGMENRATVVLQSHVDMVCEKNNDVIFNFDTDPIQTVIKDGWVCAEGTTLGADCGIGMAAALAVLASDDLVHGAIEALFTIDEETGLTGAFGLGDKMISGKKLINLDSEDEGEIFIGCAGGIDTIISFPAEFVSSPKNYSFFRVDVRGLKGGHSGDDIEKGRANSNLIVARILHHLSERSEIKLCYFDGGNLRNAIPREAYAIFGLAMSDSERALESAESIAEQICLEYKYSDQGMDIVFSEMPDVDKCLDDQTATNFISAMVASPNGVLAMSFAMKGMVETSSNLASVKFTADNSIIICSSQRSSMISSRNHAATSIECVFTLAGAEVVHSEGYPGWNPNPYSKLLKTTSEAYKSLFDVEPKVRSIHAGLECGLFLEKYPWLDMVSFGPTLRGVHSPDERLNIESVDKFWKLLVEVLRMV